MLSRGFLRYRPSGSPVGPAEESERGEDGGVFSEGKGGMECR